MKLCLYYLPITYTSIYFIVWWLGAQESLPNNQALTNQKLFAKQLLLFIVL